MKVPEQFWIDVGGTFTDCIALHPDGTLTQFKTLSSGCTRGTAAEGSSGRLLIDPKRRDDPDGFWNGAVLRLRSAAGDVTARTTVIGFTARLGCLNLADDLCVQPGQTYELDPGLPAPVLGIRWLMRLDAETPVPAVQVRFGTTRGTNALLTRTGSRTALVTTRGFADVPRIGSQERPHLFELDIRRPQPLFEAVAEVDERVAADGQILKPLDEQQAEAELARLRDAGIESVAICLLHAWTEPAHEQLLKDLCRKLGFQEVSCSSDVARQIRFVPRCETTVLDAWLNPVLRSYLEEIRRHLPDSRILVMTSAGGLVDQTQFRGKDSVLSGPAGGIVGFSRAAAAAGFQRAIGFDMGGTSTDVARFDGRFEYEQETMRAGVRVMTPVLAIETVAAGGGSICGFDGGRLFAGPASAGADPGPACYGSGGPLTVTDLNVWLGRVLPDCFPFALDTAAVERRLKMLQSDMEQAGAWPDGMTLSSLAEGLLQIANDNMVRAIRRISVARGYDPADYVLVCFGGAGGQHACAVARALGMRRVLLHPLAGILSAWGMGQADIRCRRTASVLRPLHPESLEELDRTIDRLIDEGRHHVLRQGVAEKDLDTFVELELRYSGTESTVSVPHADPDTARETFEREYRRQFGYVRSQTPIEIAAVSVEVVGRSSEERQDFSQPATGGRAEPSFTTAVFDGQPMQTAVFERTALPAGETISGPAILYEATSVICVEPGCSARILDNAGVLITVDSHDSVSSGTTSSGSTSFCPGGDRPDPVRLELMNGQFTSIAEQMGEALRRTAVSTNVRERLDYSCALFDDQGRLVVNAPHVPVHLGAMGETVRSVRRDHPRMEPGDVFVTNDPYRGGSHLPDITVVTPVFTGRPIPSFFVASRAHHADIGGIVPGSMPPFSTKLAEEGIRIDSRHLVAGGVSCEDSLRQLLGSGPYPSRNINDNLADLAAQAAANAQGAALLQRLCDVHGVDAVLEDMRAVHQAAERRMRQALSRLDDGEHAFEDRLDDGTVIRVSIRVSGDRAVIDFSGTADVHPGNLNANRAITTAAVLYSFRCLLDEDVPLNAGVLEPLDLIIPPGLLNPPAGATAEQSPAMVGGNVETSQRIVDVLLGALELAAASQGTMNNLTFGDETFGYYETIGGGAGATPSARGADAVHTHMTNTRLTDPEVLEHRYPVRLKHFGIRHGSGGRGRFRGGDGIVRSLEFLKDLNVSMLSQRRTVAPWGLRGGDSGRCGRNTLQRRDGRISDLGGSFSVAVQAGDVLTVETPGGGAFGPEDGDSAAAAGANPAGDMP